MTAAPAAPGLDRGRTAAALAITVVVLAVFNVARSTVLPEGWDLGANIAMAGVVAALAWWAGESARELGLARDRWGRGLAYGGAVLAVVAVGVALGTLLPATRGLFDDRRADIGLSDLLFEIGVSVPFGTVLLEELAFRGSLLALLRRLTTTTAAVLWSSVLFGLWHIAPAITSRGENAAVTDAGVPTAVTVMVTVGVTTLAGVGFCWLRLRSGSLLAPMVAHLATNAVPFTAAWALAH